ncbi:hypothetical protein HMPREF9621_01049, partial [Cutibacterium modestum HL037PA2]
MAWIAVLSVFVLWCLFLSRFVVGQGTWGRAVASLIGRASSTTSWLVG